MFLGLGAGLDQSGQDQVLLLQGPQELQGLHRGRGQDPGLQCREEAPDQLLQGREGQDRDLDQDLRGKKRKRQIQAKAW